MKRSFLILVAAFSMGLSCLNGLMAFWTLKTFDNRTGGYFLIFAATFFVLSIGVSYLANRQKSEAPRGFDVLPPPKEDER